MKLIASHSTALLIGATLALIATWPRHKEHRTEREIFAAGAVAGVDIARLYDGLLKQGVDLSADEIKRMIERQWQKFDIER